MMADGISGSRSDAGEPCGSASAAPIRPKPAVCPGLLVSVRSVDEAKSALQAGVDIVDLKEPLRGPLGPVDRAVVMGVARLAESGRARASGWSVALGELVDFVPRHPELPRCFGFAKFGLARTGSQKEAGTRWRSACRWLESSVARPVAVAYADWANCGGMPPGEALDFVDRCGDRILLVDTWDKGAGSLLTAMPVHELTSLVQRARARGIAVGLAGSLSVETIPLAASADPDWIGVRGAVCTGGRDGVVSSSKIAAVRQLLRCGNGQPVGPGAFPV